jgi:hypothetical protein
MDAGGNGFFEFLQSKNSKRKNGMDAVFPQRKGLERKSRSKPQGRFVRNCSVKPGPSAAGGRMRPMGGGVLAVCKCYAALEKGV